MVRVTRPGDPVTVGLTRLGQARVLEERPTERSGALIEGDTQLLFLSPAQQTRAEQNLQSLLNSAEILTSQSEAPPSVGMLSVRVGPTHSAQDTPHGPHGNRNA